MHLLVSKSYRNLRSHPTIYSISASFPISWGILPFDCRAAPSALRLPMAEGSNSWSHDCEIGHGYDDDHLFDFDNPSDTDEQGSSSRRSPGASRSPLPFGRAGPATPQSAAARSVASPSPAPRLSLSPIAGPSIRRRTRHTTPQLTSYTRTRSHSREQAGYEGPTDTDEELVHSRNISEEAAAIALDAAPGISPGRGATRRETPGISPRRADQGNRGNGGYHQA